MKQSCFLPQGSSQRFHQFYYATKKKQISVTNFAQQHRLTEQEIDDLRCATRDLKLVAIFEITSPQVAKFLRTSTIDPIIKNIKSDPNRSKFQNEDVTKLISATPSNPFSNFTMHLAPGGQSGIHVHPYGPRNLLVFSDKPWFLFCGAISKPNEEPTDIIKIAKIEIPAGQYIATFPANMPHGFDSSGDGTVAHSIHAFDEAEIAALGIADSKDVMKGLTRILDSKPTIIGGTPVPYRFILELQRGAS